MKILKILGITLLQCLCYAFFAYILFRAWLSGLGVSDSTAAIGIIGGADGPTAVFLSSKYHLALDSVYFYLPAFILTLICNLSAFNKNRSVSWLQFSLSSFLILFWSILSSYHTTEVWLLMSVLALGLLLIGYWMSGKIYRK